MTFCGVCLEEAQMAFTAEADKNGKKCTFCVHLTERGKYKGDKVAMCIYNNNVDPIVSSTHQMTFEEAEIISNLLGMISQFRFVKPVKKEKPVETIPASPYDKETGVMPVDHVKLEN